MKREIKYRAYQPNHKNMLEVDEIGFKSGKLVSVTVRYPEGCAPRVIKYTDEYQTNFPLHNEDGEMNLILMQYTGLLDKDGKEVYEGDVIQYYQPYAQRTDVHFVKWDDYLACFGLFEHGNEWCKESDWIKIESLLIIGNIHDNPELLNKEKLS